MSNYLMPLMQQKALLNLINLYPLRGKKKPCISSTGEWHTCSVKLVLFLHFFSLLFYFLNTSSHLPRRTTMYSFFWAFLLMTVHLSNLFSFEAHWNIQKKYVISKIWKKRFHSAISMNFSVFIDLRLPEHKEIIFLQFYYFKYL